MAVGFLNSIDLNHNELLNWKLQNLSSDPTLYAGRMWYGTANSRPKWSTAGAAYEIYPSDTLNTPWTNVLRDASGNFAAGTITANLNGNATTATRLQTARQISLSGDAGGSVNFDGSANVDIVVTIADDSHTHTPGTLSLTNGYFFRGNASNVAEAVQKTQISISGFGAATADVDFGGYKLTGVGDPSNPTDVVNLRTLDSRSVGLQFLNAVRLATTAALPTSTYSSGTKRLTASANGALSVDSVAVVVGDRILVKNQATQSQNGLYVVIATGSAGAAWILERSPDFDTSAETLPGSHVFVEAGVTLVDTGWVMNATPPVTLDTTAITWTQFNGSGTVTAGRGLVKVGKDLHFAQSSDYTTGSLPYATGASTIGMLTAVATGNALISAGTGTAPTWGKIGLTTHVSGILPVANGGTGTAYFGITGLTALRTITIKNQNQTLPVFYAGAITGNGVTTSFTVNHALNTRDVTVAIVQAQSPYAQVFTDVESVDANNVTVRFATAPGVGTNYRAVVTGY